MRATCMQLAFQASQIISFTAEYAIGILPALSV